MTGVELVRGRLSVVEARERELLSQESYDQIFGPFDRGEFHELTDQEWQALMDGKRPRPLPIMSAPPCGSLRPLANLAVETDPVGSRRK